MANSSLEIKYEMAAYDRKDRAYYDNFTAVDQKKFSTYLMLKWGANVTGSQDLQAYYVMACNERVNKNFFDLNKHPKLQWLLCTTVSPGMGGQYHYWLKAKKKEGASTNKSLKFVAQMYPHMKQDELEMMVQLNDKKALKALAKELGWDQPAIKKALG